MISKMCYSSYLNRYISVKAPDVETLKSCIRISGEWRDGLPRECELWHMLQALIDAYEETLDSLRRCIT